MEKMTQYRVIFISPEISNFLYTEEIAELQKRFISYSLGDQISCFNEVKAILHNFGLSDLNTFIAESNLNTAIDLQTSYKSASITDYEYFANVLLSIKTDTRFTADQQRNSIVVPTLNDKIGLFKKKVETLKRRRTDLNYSTLESIIARL